MEQKKLTLAGDNLVSLCLIGKKGIIIFAFGVILSACKMDKPVVFNDAELIKGNASSIILEKGINNINLEDYVLDITRIDSVTAPPELKQNKERGMLTLEGELTTQIAVIKIWSASQAYTIPVRRATKTNVTLTYVGAANEIKAKGEFNAWNAQSSTFTKTEKGFIYSMALPPGNYQYLFVIDGKEKRDPSNKDSIDNGMGGWNSVIRIARPDAQKLPIISTKSTELKTIKLSLRNPAKEVIVLWKNFLLDYRSVKLSEKEIEIDARTSDAIALAVRFECPIYTYEFILSAAGIILEDQPKEGGMPTAIEEPVEKKTAPKDDKDLTKKSTEELKEMLKGAIAVSYTHLTLPTNREV